MGHPHSRWTLLGETKGVQPRIASIFPKSNTLKRLFNQEPPEAMESTLGDERCVGNILIATFPTYRSIGRGLQHLTIR
jgi:hypothetical protein